jgi:hypothetical protein
VTREAAAERERWLGETRKIRALPRGRARRRRRRPALRRGWRSRRPPDGRGGQPILESWRSPRRDLRLRVSPGARRS